MGKAIFDRHEAALGRNQDNEVKQVDGAVSLAPYERLVEVTTPGEGSYTITLPYLSQCPGAVFALCAINTGGGEVAIADRDDGIADLAVGDNLSAANDYVFLLNVAGLKWIVLEEVTT